jgi:hypothetical protein
MDFNWLGWNAIGWGDDVIRKLYNFQFDLHRKIGKKVSHLIWLTTAWCIWLEENDILFDEKVVNILGGGISDQEVVMDLSTPCTHFNKFCL